MAAARYYVVTETGAKQGETTRRLVKASTPSQAIRHAAKARFSAEVATQDDVLGLAKFGYDDATKEPE